MLERRVLEGEVLPPAAGAGLARRGGELAPRRGAAVVGAGRVAALVGNYGGIPVLTVKVVDYAGKSPDEAAADVWAAWNARYPGALIQVVHGDDWEVVR